MNENIKTFSLVVITICVFIMTVIDILDMMQDRAELFDAHTSLNTSPATDPNGFPPAPPESSTSIVPPLGDQPITSIHFEEMSHDFGDMMKGDVVNYSFRFKNTGSSPLLISNAHGSCGCTIPSYPKEPIPPGAEANIEVQFNSAGKEGLQNKSIAVTANTEPRQTVLSITANVSKKE
ncbi:MAG: DUF1573 domain-containing protein [Chitinophagales bacterium]